jgi:hypothetical protein
LAGKDFSPPEIHPRRIIVVFFCADGISPYFFAMRGFQRSEPGAAPGKLLYGFKNVLFFLSTYENLEILNHHNI